MRIWAGATFIILAGFVLGIKTVVGVLLILIAYTLWMDQLIHGPES